jgi:hypothetical protein
MKANLDAASKTTHSYSKIENEILTSSAAPAVIFTKEDSDDL